MSWNGLSLNRDSRLLDRRPDGRDWHAATNAVIDMQGAALNVEEFVGLETLDSDIGELESLFDGLVEKINNPGPSDVTRYFVEADEAIDPGDIVTLAGLIAVPDGNLAAATPLGIAVLGGASGADIEFKTNGDYTNIGLALTPEDPVYWDGTEFTQTPTDTPGDYIIEIGVAITTNKIRIGFQDPVQVPE